MIDGVQIIPLSQILDYRGKIMKMMDINSPYFSKFGEIYFSSIHSGIVKAWHIHKEMELNYVCVTGKILLVLQDWRLDSPTHRETMEIYLSPEDYKLVKVPTYILNGFKGLGGTDSIVANLATVPHSEKEVTRISIDDMSRYYDWWKRGE